MTLLTKEQLWHAYAPSFNFELDAEELLAEALKRGFVTKHNATQYLVNEDY